VPNRVGAKSAHAGRLCRNQSRELEQPGAGACPRYFETPEGTEFIETKTYFEHEEELQSPRNISFNHGIGEILTALLASGLRLTAFEEHESVPWNAFGGAGSGDAQGEYRLRERPKRLPATYTVQASKSR
jgi:hypothetical protein